MTSNAAKCSRSWAGVVMPAWWAPRKANASRPLGAGSPLGGGRPAGRERTGREAGGGDAAADQSASRRPTPGQDSTAAVSWDSGSESALTAFASSWTSSGVRSS